LEDIAEATDGYRYVTIYRDTRQLDFERYSIMAELMQATAQMAGCCRVYMVGNKTALLIGSGLLDYATISAALGRTSFKCDPIDPAENKPGKIMEKLAFLYGLDL
jgi:hypothetical protein